MSYHYSHKLIQAVESIPRMDGRQCQAQVAALFGIQHGDSCTTLADALAKYAEDYSNRYPDSRLAEDGVLGEGWLSAYRGIATLLNGEGFFDGGTLSHRMYEAAKAAGFEDKDL